MGSKFHFSYKRVKFTAAELEEGTIFDGWNVLEVVKGDGDDEWVVVLIRSVPVIDQDEIGVMDEIDSLTADL